MEIKFGVTDLWCEAANEFVMEAERILEVAVARIVEEEDAKRSISLIGFSSRIRFKRSHAAIILKLGFQTHNRTRIHQWISQSLSFPETL